MQELMRFEDVAELLALDVRDEKRNRLFLNAVSEEICLYLDRNLLAGMATETRRTDKRAFVPDQYPVREFTEIVDVATGSPLKLVSESIIRDIQRPDAQFIREYQIQSESDLTLRYTYRYGYELAEIPALIQDYLLDRMRKRLRAISTPEDDEEDSQDEFKKIKAYRRITL